MTSGPSPRTTALSCALIVAIAVLAYANTFSVPFVFDDIAAVTQNPSIERFATAFSPPDALSVTGRPLANLSVALNYAISGREVWSYHALNLALHAACALVVFTLLRRTLALVRITHSDFTALAITLIWAIHPLHTGAVTYVMQRTELLVSLCYLLTVACFARGSLKLSVLACAIGMTAKEVMVTAPLAVLLYDRTFACGSFRTAWQARRGYYAALAATWLILGALLLGTDHRGGSAGLNAGMAWSDYALTQPTAIARYLQLALWPNSLVFDYGAQVVSDGATIALCLAIILALIIGIVAAIRRAPAVAFSGIWFFALLAPSSSVVPIATQAIAEHRVYLALVAPIAVAFVALQRCLGRRALWVGLSATAALAVATFARNTDYASLTRLWHDTATKQPGNPRAHYNLGLARWQVADPAGARTAFAAAIAVQPNHGLAHHKLGQLLEDRSAALPHLETAARLLPQSASAHYDTAVALLMLRRVPESVPYLQTTLRLHPAHAAAHYNLGNALTELGRYPEALAEFETAARLDPADASARNNAARLREYLKR